MLQLEKKAERRRLMFSFFLPVLCSFFIFLPFVVIGQGFFTYCGDYNSQQIPFWMYCHDYIRSGAGSFTWETDLGGSFLNSYSFYTLGSPFFWLSLLLPNAWLPYAMVPLFMLKFGVSGLGAYLYLRRYLKNRQWAVLGCLLYALSGWGIYNIFFNHFLDCMALFPFLLWGMDEFVYEKRRGIFAVFVALNLLCNYFFFLGEVVFCALYFFVKLLSGEFRLSVKEFFVLVFEAVVGAMMGCMLILPGAHSLLSNPRTTTHSNGYGLLLYGKVQQYFAILVSAFLPPDPPYLPNLFKDCTIKWTSMSLYLPLFGCSGVIAYLRSSKKTANRRLLFCCLIMALVPILNSSFYAFNSSYYARWYYMPILIMALCTMQAMEDADIQLELGLKPCAAVLCAVALFGLVPTKVDGVWQIGAVEEPEQFWGMLCFAAAGLLAVFLLSRFKRKKHWPTHRFIWRLTAGVMAASTLFGVVHIAIGKFPQYKNDYDYKTQCYDVRNEISLPTDHFYRTDSYECYENLSLFFQIPNIRCFNSTVTPSILEFYPSVGVKRDVSSKPEIDLYALRSLLSVQYILTPEDTRQELDDKVCGYGYQYSYSTGGYAVFENQNYIPMGFTYDYYMLPADVENVDSEKVANLMLRALLLTEEQVETYGHLLTRASTQQLQATDYNTFVQDCADRKAHSAQTFTATRSGFEATITLDRENLVFFSVPYDEGYTATVNGQETEVLKVNNGLIAVLANAGENQITLTLDPVWLTEAKYLTCAGILLYAGYLVLLRRRSKKG
ncbi:MAG: YfhO family protein [Pygmaiobacter massiliensis]|nr:YfhO family protein [Pygmaiobacter massiliensis]